MPKFIDITGQKFGMLTALYRGENQGRRAVWVCRCDCGNIHSVIGECLRGGHSKSCGCLHKIAISTHGMCDSPEWQTWQNMIHRCENKNNPGYKTYGARGIKVCDRWKDFDCFYKDMGARPSEKHSIDRINNDGNYSPDNCRWATKKEQARNTRQNNLVTFNGETKPLVCFIEELGLNKNTVRGRLRRGFSLEMAFSKENFRGGR